VPFREAHEVVGTLVANCISSNRTFADLTASEWADVHPVFAKERPPLSAMESIAARDVEGGVAPNRVADQLAEVRTFLQTEREKSTSLLAQRDELFTKPTDTLA
jgi:argininosuccinate lyase